MILKALYDYYNRCGNLTRKGLEQKEIGYLIVIDKDGSFIKRPLKHLLYYKRLSVVVKNTFQIIFGTIMNTSLEVQMKVLKKIELSLI